MDWVSHVLARAAIHGETLEDALKAFRDSRQTRYHTPVAEWLHRSLRTIFSDQLPDQDSYDYAFDRAEIVLGVVAQDSVNVRVAADPDGRTWGSSHWYGRSGWRSRHSDSNPVTELAHELSTRGAQWGPLRGRLFGGDQSRAETALEKYADNFSQFSRGMW